MMGVAVASLGGGRGTEPGVGGGPPLLLTGCSDRGRRPAKKSRAKNTSGDPPMLKSVGW